MFKITAEKKVDCTNLFCVDLVCHGICSPKLWADYVKKLSGNKQIKSVNFRHKSPNFGWETYALCITFKKHKQIYEQEHSRDQYFHWFLSDLALRDSCFKCKFGGKKSFADITLGDFWGVPAEVRCQFKSPQDGISLVLIHNEQGKELFDEAKRNMFTVISDYDTAKKGNPVLELPTPYNDLRGQFFDDFSKMRLDKFCEKWRQKYNCALTFLEVLRC